MPPTSDISKALEVDDILYARIINKDRQEGTWTDFNRLFEWYFLKGEILSVKEKSDEEDIEDVKQGSLF